MAPKATPFVGEWENPDKARSRPPLQRGAGQHGSETGAGQQLMIGSAKPNFAAERAERRLERSKGIKAGLDRKNSQRPQTGANKKLLPLFRDGFAPRRQIAPVFGETHFSGRNVFTTFHVDNKPLSPSALWGNDFQQIC